MIREVTWGSGPAVLALIARGATPIYSAMLVRPKNFASEDAWAVDFDRPVPLGPSRVTVAPAGHSDDETASTVDGMLRAVETAAEARGAEGALLVGAFHWNGRLSPEVERDPKYPDLYTLRTPMSLGGDTLYIFESNHPNVTSVSVSMDPDDTVLSLPYPVAHTVGQPDLVSRAYAGYKSGFADGERAGRWALQREVRTVLGV